MPESISQNARIIAVGDIHGCIASLKKLCRQLELQPSDQLVFLGDYIDRGKNSQAVIDFLIDLQRSFTCFFLMGNHELMLLDCLKTGNASDWLRNGGKETLQSYAVKSARDLPLSHIGFLRSCHYYLESKDFIFVHGGLDPDMSIKNNIGYLKPADFCWMRTHLRSSYLETNRYNWEKTVVCAHTPAPEIINLKKLIAIDTGCVYKDDPSLGKLSAIVLPSRQLVQTVNID